MFFIVEGLCIGFLHGEISNLIIGVVGHVCILREQECERGVKMPVLAVFSCTFIVVFCYAP